MTSPITWRLVLKRCMGRRSIFIDPNSASLKALFQQLPRRLVEALMPYAVCERQFVSLTHHMADAFVDFTGSR